MTIREGDQKGVLFIFIFFFFKMRGIKAKLYLKSCQSSEEKGANSVWVCREGFPQDDFELGLEWKAKLFQRKKSLYAKEKL